MTNEEIKEKMLEELKEEGFCFNQSKEELVKRAIDFTISLMQKEHEKIIDEVVDECVDDAFKLGWQENVLVVADMLKEELKSTLKQRIKDGE